jgi:hypothetical protein
VKNEVRSDLTSSSGFTFSLEVQRIIAPPQPSRRLRRGAVI